MGRFLKLCSALYLKLWRPILTLNSADFPGLVSRYVFPGVVSQFDLVSLSAPCLD